MFILSPVKMSDSFNMFWYPCQRVSEIVSKFPGKVEPGGYSLLISVPQIALFALFLRAFPLLMIM